MRLPWFSTIFKDSAPRRLPDGWAALAARSCRGLREHGDDCDGSLTSIPVPRVDHPVHIGLRALVPERDRHDFAHPKHRSRRELFGIGRHGDRGRRSSPAVISLSRRVDRTLILAKAPLFLTLAILGLASAVIGFSAAAPLADKPTQAVADRPALSKSAMGLQATVAPKTDAQPNGATVNLHGRVLSPDGKPIAGPRFFCNFPSLARKYHSRTAASQPAPQDGPFEAPVSREDLTPSRAFATSRPIVTALATGLVRTGSKSIPTMLAPRSHFASAATTSPSRDVSSTRRDSPLRDLTVRAASLSDFQARAG